VESKRGSHQRREYVREDLQNFTNFVSKELFRSPRGEKRLARVGGKGREKGNEVLLFRKP